MQITYNAHYGYGIVSTLIRWFSRGRYNHISIELDGVVYEAKEGKGVIATTKGAWDDSTVVDSISFELSPFAETEIFVFLQEQIGKKYDYRGVLSFLWGFTRPRMGRWFCSELAFVTVVKMRGLKGSDFQEKRVSPHLFWGFLKLLTCKNAKD